MENDKLLPGEFMRLTKDIAEFREYLVSANQKLTDIEVRLPMYRSKDVIEKFLNLRQQLSILYDYDKILGTFLMELK